MSDQAQANRVFPASLILLALAAGGLLLVEQPFKSNRYNELRSPDTLTTPSEQLVDARLWQDPLRPILSDWQDLLSQAEGNGGILPNVDLPLTINGFRDSVKNHIDAMRTSSCQSDFPNLLVLPVLVPGTHYSNDVEVRRRSRYALINALTSSQYAPIDARTVGYFLSPRAGPFLPKKAAAGVAANPPPRNPLTVGFEWYLPNRLSVPKIRCTANALSKWDGILVLWVSEADLGSNPMARLDSLLAYITPDSTDVMPGGARSGVSFDVIGPVSSNTLAVIFDEASAYIKSGAEGTSDGRALAAAEFNVAADRMTGRSAIDLALRPYENAAGDSADDNPVSVSEPESRGAAGLSPEPGELEWASSADLASLLEGQLIEYLDAEIPKDVSMEALRGCAQDVVASQHLELIEDEDETNNIWDDAMQRTEACLSLPAYDSIIDSDPSWSTSVSQSWIRASNWYLLNPHLADELREAASEFQRPAQEFVTSIVTATTFYLDWGIPQGTDIQALVSCIGEEFGAPDTDPDQKAIEECLKNNITFASIGESDDEWASSVVTDWFDLNSHVLTRETLHADAPVEESVAEYRSILDRVRILSPRSTMPLSYIAGLGTRRGDGTKNAAQGAQRASPIVSQVRTDEDFLQVLHKAGLPIREFRTTVARDQWTAALLVEELWRRGVFRNGRDDLAILFELDSDYGRALPMIIDCYVHQIYERNDIAKPSATDSAADPGILKISNVPCLSTSVQAHAKQYVHSYGYLAGIDGMEVPEATYVKKIERDSGKSDGAQTDRAGSLLGVRTDLELPVGPSQYDYLRRLSRMIKRSDETLHTEEESRGIRAVGIFGTDIYDKQLILQALHKSLPNAIFFTTDLDARLSHPSQFEWNRNLIIGSAYGLGVESNLFTSPDAEDALVEEVTASGSTVVKHVQFVNVELPPLRDVYQTAFYLTTKLALMQGEEQEKAYFGQAFKPPLPRLFEIGRYGEIDITPVTSGPSDTNCDPPGDQDPASRLSYTPYDSCIHGALGWTQYVGLESHQRMIKVAIILSPLLLLTFFWARRMALLQKSTQEIEWRAYLLATVVGSAATVALAIWLLNWRDPAGEPWFLFHGISAIPTLVLRLIAFIYAIIIAIITIGRFRQDNLDLSLRFSLKLEFPATWPRFTKGEWRRISILSWVREINDETRHGMRSEVSAQDIWRRYRELGNLYNGLVRAAIPSLIVIGVVLYWLLDGMHEHALLRGALADFDKWMTAITAVSVILVIYLTTDAMQVCQVFIRALARFDVVWPRDEDHEIYGKMKLDKMVYDRLHCIDMIMYRTEMITPTIILPFALVFFLLVARSTLFDRWEWSGPLVAIYVGLSGYLLVRALLMQREAEQARDRIVKRLQRRKNSLRGVYSDKPAVLSNQISQVDSVIEYILNVRRGAFVPWLRHPIVQAIFLPFSGFGALAMLDAFL